MKDFDLSKITGNEPPLITDDEKDAELYRLRRELAEMTAKARIDEQQCDDMTRLAADAVARAERAEAAARALARECEAWAAWEKAESLVGTEDEVDVNANNAWDWLQECRKATDDRNALRWAKENTDA